jgi:nitrogen fixation protein FixH
MTRSFTGWHMAAILVGFFAVVIGVNVTMARLAESTFGGVLAENGYVASQDYNGWIDAAKRQDQLGWSASTRVENQRLVLEVSGVAFPSAEVRLVHPLGRAKGTRLAMDAVSATRLVSTARVPPGRWQVHVVIRSAGREARYIEEVRG